MTSLATLAALAAADFRERVRRPSFLVVLAAATFLGFEAVSGTILVKLGHVVGEPTSAWAGTLMAIVGNAFLSLAGFYVVKGSIANDERTGVGEILAATAISRPAYTLAKAASHWMVLSAMIGVLALAAVALLLTSPGHAPLDFVALLTPMVLLSLPAMAITAACAVLFETIRFLRRGLGNFVWMFAWAGILAVGMETGTIDPLGMKTVRDAAAPAVTRIDPAWHGAFSITIASGAEERVTGRFRFDGLPLSGDLVGERAAILAIAVALALAAALPFDRFDPSRRRERRARREAPARASSAAPVAGSGAAALRPLPPQRDAARLSLALAEVRIAIAGMPLLWRIGTLALFMGGLLVPAIALQGWITVAFLWPALVWSGLGSREREFGVESLLAACPRPRLRQLPALVTAGAITAFATAGGVVLRFLFAGEPARALAVAAACVAMPVAALALGLLSRGPRLFEGLYIALWYVGPLNRVWSLDFTGSSPESASRGVPLVFLAVAAVLLAAALAVEHRRGATDLARFA